MNIDIDNERAFNDLIEKKVIEKLKKNIDGCRKVKNISGRKLSDSKKGKFKDQEALHAHYIEILKIYGEGDRA